MFIMKTLANELQQIYTMDIECVIKKNALDPYVLKIEGLS